MSTNIDNLRVLFLDNKKQDNENIRQRLSDGLHCPVFFDYAPAESGYFRRTAGKGYDVIIAQQDFLSGEILSTAAACGIPVICLFDAPEIDVSMRLIDKGAAGCVPKNDPVQLGLAIYKALQMQESDISDQKHDTKISNDLEYLMLEILDNLNDAFYVVDHEWRLTYINRKIETCWACKREDLLGKNFWDCFPQLQNLPDSEMHITSMNKRIPVQWETSSPSHQFWADMSTYPTQNGGLAVFFRDTSEKKHAEEVLRVSKERQSILLKLSDSLRLLDDPNEIQEAAARVIGVYLGVERAFYCDVVVIKGTKYFSLENMYSVTEINVPPGLHPIDSPGVLANDNWEGRNIVVCDMESDPRINDSIRPSLREQRLGAWVSVPLMRNGQFVASFTVHQGPARTWMPDEISLIEEATTRTWAAVERVRAEAALRKSEQHALRLVSELENADRTKNEFINAVSHELRNPLAAIAASLSMLDILDANPQTRSARSIIKRQTAQLCHLVDDLLDLTRITNDKIQLNLEYVDLNELAQSSAYDQRTLFEEKGIELQTVIGDAPLYAWADPVRISQIIGNLLHNAFKFTEKAGKTVLTVYRRGNEAVITVKDNGIGIESSFLPDLFKTFKQASQNKGGLGLGLSIVKGIIELHEGSVSAESEGLNRGATFTVVLPIPANPLVLETPVMEEKEDYHAKPLKILLIDDNRDLAEITCLLLALYGYEVEAVFTGTDGILKAKAFLPHVIICDIGLPDIDGYEVARRISACSELGDVCLISLSGYAQASDFEYSKEAGFVTHISKPVDFENLKTILDSIAQ